MLFVIVILAAFSWYFSNQILKPAPYSLLPEFKVLAMDAHSVTFLSPFKGRNLPTPKPKDFYNLLWENADGSLSYGELGPIVSEDATSVRRIFSLRHGQNAAANSPARLDNWFFRENPNRIMAMTMKT
ncbi:MAG: hypothetical protein R2865_13575 [Deinococcales bacterium]